MCNSLCAAPAFLKSVRCLFHGGRKIENPEWKHPVNTSSWKCCSSMMTIGSCGQMKLWNVTDNAMRTAAGKIQLAAHGFSVSPSGWACIPGLYSPTLPPGTHTVGPIGFRVAIMCVPYDVLLTPQLASIGAFAKCVGPLSDNVWQLIQISVVGNVCQYPAKLGGFLQV